MKLKRYLYKKVESTNNVAIRLIKKGNQREKQVIQQGKRFKERSRLEKIQRPQKSSNITSKGREEKTHSAT